MIHKARSLRLRRLGIDTYQEPVVYLHHDCHVCRSEGFRSHSLVRIDNGQQHILASVHIITSDILSKHEAGLSESAWHLLKADAGSKVSIRHAKPADSMSHVRRKLMGGDLNPQAAREIINDISLGRYSDIQLAAYVAAGADERLSPDEIIHITRAMVETGHHCHWQAEKVLDKHCVGGLPGNRTTPIVVAIVTACGLIMPKTSSRAITSPAGTADTMATLTTVELSLSRMRKVVEATGGCLAWGGSVSLSPADDRIIQVERVLDLDSCGQLVASVISKKVAAGSTHVLIDLPIGPTAKVRSKAAAIRLTELLCATGQALGLEVSTLYSDGSQPVGYGVGPALEAIDVLAVLQNQPEAPGLLRRRALDLAGPLLELGGAAAQGEGYQLAADTLASGAAWTQFQRICDAQGGLKQPEPGRHQHQLVAPRGGLLSHIDNRFLARLAKLAGAPHAPGAGIRLQAQLGQKLEAGAPLLTLYAENRGELAYALDFYQQHPNSIYLEEEQL